MFKMIKNPETGETCIRPMLVGSIKNKYLRRLAIMAAYPFTLLVTWVINYAALIIAFVLGLVVDTARFVSKFVFFTYRHIRMIFQAPWNSEVWNRPRTSKDEWMN